MTYTYIVLEREGSWLHFFTRAMIIFQDGRRWEFTHNFPPAGPVTIEKLLLEWKQSTPVLTLNGFIQYVKQWRDRRKWHVFRNKHFFDCFVIAGAKKRSFPADEMMPLEEWWMRRI